MNSPEPLSVLPISSLHTPISPPPSRPSLAAIEAGQTPIQNPLDTCSAHLSKHVRARPDTDTEPQISLADWKALYEHNLHPHGHHFVIHQHDHPVAGPHYDLRLQFSASSSVSWSIMYGLPGDANSGRLNRNATETRVHCLWNHLIETASAKTGSLLIWDTGEYEILPEKDQSRTGPETDDEYDEQDNHASGNDNDESEKLRRAFQNHKIRLRLHGVRLPSNYTVFLRRDKCDFRSGGRMLTSRKRKRSEEEKKDGSGEADYQIRLNNAYPGSTNDIGSVHQRRWFLTLDRGACGFVPEEPGLSLGKKRWVRRRDRRSGELLGFDPFYVRGPAEEKSVVTGRLARDVLEDEKVEGFVPRRGWRPVLT